VAGYRHPAGDALTVHYASAANTLQFSLGPSHALADGAGTWFQVSHASAWGLSGRWVGLETATPSVRRAGILVPEPRAGYFCAMRHAR
jgi:hypothetical protein